MTDTSFTIPTLELTDTLKPLPRDTSRFRKFSPDPRPPIRANPTPPLAHLSTAEPAAGPHRPTDLTEVILQT